MPEQHFVSSLPSRQAIDRQRWPLAMRLFYFLCFMAIGCILPYLNLHFQELGLSPKTIGLIAAISPAASVVVAPLWGALADRLAKPHYLMGALSIGAAGAMIVLSFQTSVVWIALSIFLMAIFAMSIMPQADALAVAWTRGEAGLSYGRLRLHGSIGWMVGVWVMGQITERLGFRAIFYGYALLMGLSALSTLGFILKPQPNKEENPQTRALLRNSGLIMLLIASLVLSLTAQANLAFFPLYMDGLGAQPGIIGLAISVAAVAEMPVMFTADRFIKRAGTLPVLTIAFTLFIGQWALMALAPSYWWLILTQVLVGPSFAIWWVASVKYVDEIASPGQSAAAQSLLSGVSYGLAAIIGNPLGGFVFDYFGGRWLYIFGIPIALLALGLLYFTRRSHEKERLAVSDL